MCRRARASAVGELPPLVGAEAAVPGREAERTKSPLECSPVPPVARDAERRPLREPVALVRQERRVGGDDDDDRARALAPASARGQRDHVGADPLADGDAVTRNRSAGRSSPGRARRRCAAVLRHDARRRADPALEAVADHPGAAADAALRHRPGRRRASACVDVLGPDVLAVDVVEEAVLRLADHRQRPARLRVARARPAATIASRTTPTVCVFVSPIGVVSMPDSRTHSRPVISPLPFSRWQPAKTGSRPGSPSCGQRRPSTPGRGRRRPRSIVVWPTRTPATSVIAFAGPGASRPISIPSSRARTRETLPAYAGPELSVVVESSSDSSSSSCRRVPSRRGRRSSPPCLVTGGRRSGSILYVPGFRSTVSFAAPVLIVPLLLDAVALDLERVRARPVVDDLSVDRPPFARRQRGRGRS